LSVDYVYWACIAVYFLWEVILYAAAGRGLQLARGFTSRAYRTRAYYMAGLTLALGVADLGNFLPSNFLPTPTNLTLLEQVISDIGGLGYTLALFVAFVLVDKNIQLMREVDFFHRDSLRWSKVRKPLLILVILLSAELIATAFLNLPSSSPALFFVLATYFPGFGFCLGYAAVSLIVTARRSAYRDLRRYSILLGIALAFGVVSSTIWIPLGLVTSIDIENLASAVPGFLSGYFLYRATMSMSPLGRVSKEALQGPAEAQSTLIST
jgi:hypothetical protein